MYRRLIHLEVRCAYTARNLLWASHKNRGFVLLVGFQREGLHSSPKLRSEGETRGVNETIYLRRRMLGRASGSPFSVFNGIGQSTRGTAGDQAPFGKAAKDIDDLSRPTVDYDD